MRARLPLLALVGVTAIWGVTFVQVKDAVALYPVFAFLTLRFGLATATLAVPAWPRARDLGSRGVAAGLGIGLVLAAGYAFQTLGLERTSVSATGFITGLFVVITPLLATLLFGVRLGVVTWLGVAVATIGLALLSGIEAGELLGDGLVLVAALAFSVHIILLERFAPGLDAVALTALQMLSAFVSLGVIALALGQL